MSIEPPAAVSTMTEQTTDLTHLTLNSTLADLPTYNFQVSPQVLGEMVARQLEEYPSLPGVIIIENNIVLGAFSRRKFLEQVGQHYGVAVYLKRPISVMLKAIAPNHLLLSSTCTIQEAAELALNRPLGWTYEPIVVEFPDQTYHLLDIYILLLAQSRLLALSHQQEQNRRQLTESLQKIGQRLSSSLDWQKVLKRILKEVDKLVTYERGAVLLQKGGHLEIVAQRGFGDKERTRALRILIQSTNADIFQRLVQTRRAVVIGDVTTEPSWQQVEWLPVDRSWMGIPLVNRDQVIGMLSLTRQDAHAFTAEDVDWVETFAGQAAVALENARLYNQVTQLNGQLEQKVEERTQELNHAYNILEKLDQTKSDFIKVSAHELRTPITVIKGYAQVLSANPLIQQDAKVEEMMSGIISGADRLHQVVNSILDVTKIASGSLTVYAENTLLGHLIAQICEQYGPDLQQRQLTLTTTNLDSLPPLNGDTELLKKVFQALIVNAIKYTPDEGSIRIDGQVVADNGATQLQIAIQDSGIGIDPDQQALIFEKFYQTGELALHSSGHTKFKGGGPGLGLAIAKGIVEAHDGHIWVESPGHDEERYPGSCFYVRLPLTV